MFRFVTVQRGERVVHLVDGVPVSVLGPGRHFVWTLSGVHEFVHRAITTATALEPIRPGDPFPPNPPGATEWVLGQLERAAILVDGELIGCLGPGRYRWWEELGKPELLRADLSAPPTPIPADDPLQGNVDKWFSIHTYATPVVWTRGTIPLGLLPPGRYRWWFGTPWSFQPVPRDLVALGADTLDPLPAGARVVEVPRDHRAIVRIDGAFHKVLGPGRYLWWEPAGRLELRLTDANAEPAALADDDTLPAGQGAEELTGTGTTALVLTSGGQPVRALAPGRYRAWAGSRWGLKAVPLSLQSLDVAPQDLLTKDQVAVRLKAAVSVRVVEPVKVLSQPDWPNQVYTAVQLAMREVVTGRELEPLLTDRGPAGDELRTRARELLPDLGLALEAAAIKDVILPGEVKELLNRVTLARKEAEALAIKRREETAQTRQLANTARLLENNPVLMRLKELEALGDLAARIERITLVGSGDLVKQVLLSNLSEGPVLAEPPTRD